MATKKIGVFPAAGHLGGSIVKHILKLVPASRLVFVLRHPDNLVETSAAGATVRRADYDDPSSLELVFEGVGSLMLVSYPSVEYEYRAKVGCNLRDKQL